MDVQVYELELYPLYDVKENKFPFLFSSNAYKCNKLKCASRKYIIRQAYGWWASK